MKTIQRIEIKELKVPYISSEGDYITTKVVVEVGSQISDTFKYHNFFKTPEDAARYALGVFRGVLFTSGIKIQVDIPLGLFTKEVQKIINEEITL